jgi:hypothetical protein
MPTTTKEKAVLFLLKPPAIRYVRRLKKSLERDPGYLEAHQKDVGNIIIGFLAGSGFQWHRKIFEREWLELLREALSRLPSARR